MKRTMLVLGMVLFAAGAVFAQVSVPHTFVAGTPASAEEVNENFDELEGAINDQIALTIGLNSATAADQVLTWDGANWVARAPVAVNTTASNMQPYLAINYVIALTGTFPSRNSANPFIGEIMMFGGNFAPRGWAFCNGQLLPISQNAALFSLLGTTYGGDGRTTLALPDLRGRVPVHFGQGPGLTNRNLGTKGGTEQIQIVR